MEKTRNFGLDSPLDKLRNGRLLRAKDLGLTPSHMNTSLEVNQSFPRLSRKLKSSVTRVPLSKLLLNLESMNSISFSTQASFTSHCAGQSSYLEESLNDSTAVLHEDTALNPNPHKGVVTFDIITSQIMITNKIFANMLGYSTDELLTLKFRELIVKDKSEMALPDTIYNEKGDAVTYNGKVIEMKCKDESKIAVSCWLTRAENNEDCSLFIAVVEPVQRVVSRILLDESGVVLEADEIALSLFHSSKDAFVGSNLTRWIPNILWPSSVADLSPLMKVQKTTGSTDTKQSFPLTLRLEHYEAENSVVCLSNTATAPFYSASVWVYTNMSGMLLVTSENLIIDCNPVFAQLALGYTREELIGKELGDILINFTELRCGQHSSEVHHENGSFIPVSYFVNGPVEDMDIYQVWIAISTPASGNYKSISELTRTSEVSSSSLSVSRQESEENSKLAEMEMCSGDYLEHYQFVKKLGSGGFGCVHLACRNTDNKLVVTKFIKKSKVYSDSWVDAADGQRLPLEIHFLSLIEHDHIIRMLEYFENDTYFQLVMEKHGSGMDLFEFIEKTKGVPEPLAAYISKQLVEAVHYLHSQGITHRDIKDENVVLDDRFHAKLIDFGSASFLTDKPFSAFCGTFEYCSPEVLKGNAYRGPELEVWAMGTTIFILNFARNPFNGITEILQNSLEIPEEASASLKDLLFGMMDRDVDQRFSVQDVLDNDWLNQPIRIDDYDFYDICELNRSKVEFLHSRYLADDGPVISLATSTPYKAALATPKNLSFDIHDDSSVQFQCELVFNELSSNQAD